MTDIAFYISKILAAHAILIVGASSLGLSVALLVAMATAYWQISALLVTSPITLGRAVTKTN